MSRFTRTLSRPLGCGSGCEISWMSQLRRAPRVPWEGEPEHSVPAACLKHPAWLTGLLLGGKPRSREPQGRASPLLFGPDPGRHLSIGFLLGAGQPRELSRGPVSTGDLPRPGHRGLPGEAGPAGDPGGKLPHHPDRSQRPQQGEREGAGGRSLSLPSPGVSSHCETGVVPTDVRAVFPVCKYLGPV